MRRKGRLVLASYGLNDRQMTIETLVALRECDLIYSESLDGDSRASLERTCPPIISLRDIAPDDVTDLLISEVRKGKNVAYLTYGDPGILSPCERFVSRCEKEKIEYRLYPAISSLNVLLWQEKLIKSGAAGVLLSWVGAEIRAFCIDIPALVFLFGVKPFNSASVASLIVNIQRAYPSDHVVEVLSYAASTPDNPRRRKYAVSELARAWREADNQSTLYLPAVGRRVAKARKRVRGGYA